MSPEMHLRRPYNAQAADRWALGVVLFMLLTGRPLLTKERGAGDIGLRRRGTDWAGRDRAGSGPWDDGLVAGGSAFEAGWARCLYWSEVLGVPGGKLEIT